MSTSGLTSPCWRKSSRSSTQGACVEVAVGACTVGVRDTKNRGGDLLTFDHRQWSSFLTALRAP